MGTDLPVNIQEDEDPHGTHTVRHGHTAPALQEKNEPGCRHRTNQPLLSLSLFLSPAPSSPSVSLPLLLSLSLAVSLCLCLALALTHALRYTDVCTHIFIWVKMVLETAGGGSHCVCARLCAWG